MVLTAVPDANADGGSVTRLGKLREEQQADDTDNRQHDAERGEQDERPEQPPRCPAQELPDRPRHQ